MIFPAFSLMIFAIVGSFSLLKPKTRKLFWLNKPSSVTVEVSGKQWLTEDWFSSCREIWVESLNGPTSDSAASTGREKELFSNDNLS